MTTSMGGTAYITGAGNTSYSKRSTKSAQLLAVEATMAAAADAGIDVSDIDGIITYHSHVEADEIIAALSIPDVKLRALIDIGGASAVSALKMAALYVNNGAARNVLLIRGINGSSGPRKAARPSFLPSQSFRRNLEYVVGCNTPAQRYALLCQRYMYEHGLTRDHLAEIALAARSHANLNPQAQMYDRTLTKEQYLAGRPVAEPYHLFDCCLETDGACAVIVSDRPSTDGTEQPAVQILGVEEAYPDPPDDLTNRHPFLSIGLDKAAPRLWDSIGMGPSDMDAAMIYDCFTFEVIHQLEAAGFTSADNVADFVLSGSTRLTGSLPVNTHGGLLSEGHMVGLNHIVEAYRQLQGRSGARQVSGVRHIAVTGWGNLGDGSIAVLRRHHA